MIFSVYFFKMFCFICRGDFIYVGLDWFFQCFDNIVVYIIGVDYNLLVESNVIVV